MVITTPIMLTADDDTVDDDDNDVDDFAVADDDDDDVENVTVKKTFYSSSRLLIPRGSIVLALWIRWASSAFLKESRPFLSFSIGIKVTTPYHVSLCNFRSLF